MDTTNLWFCVRDDIIIESPHCDLCRARGNQGKIIQVFGTGKVDRESTDSDVKRAYAVLDRMMGVTPEMQTILDSQAKKTREDALANGATEVTKDATYGMGVKIVSKKTTGKRPLRQPKKTASK